MQQRPLGSSGVSFSALGFGCMTLIGWYGTRNDDEARATLLSALDQGVTHLDTAASYQLGENEKFVGATIRARREQLFLATKYGITRNASGQLVIDNQPVSLRQAVESSLMRLDTDRIDLFYLHRIDRETPIEESVGALAQLVKAGKIRHIGLSEIDVDQLSAAQEITQIVKDIGGGIDGVAEDHGCSGASAHLRRQPS